MVSTWKKINQWARINPKQEYVISFVFELFHCKMCGIIAILGNPKYENTKSDCLQRRGPDETGFFHDDCAVMGHARLAIVNPEAGPQPIEYNDWVVTMNGEIYNYKAGATETDCYAVPKLLERHGLRAVHYLDGVFSFVAYNRVTKEVVVARDAIGVTPLYQSTSGGTTMFSSLLMAMTGPVQIVPPGHIASFQIGETPCFTKWSAPYRTTWHGMEPAPDVVDVMTKAVGKRLAGDVPWGVLLSGGLDSSIIAALACRIAAEKRPDYPRVHTFCIGLEGSPDIAAAQEVADLLGTHHTSLFYTVEEGLAAVPDVVRVVETYDVTTIRASVPMWLLGKALKKRGIKMVLSGEGADELFAGYLYNLFCPSLHEMVGECVRKMEQLHAYDCQRANKTLGDWGIETRVPFLDTAMVDLAMNRLHPVFKMSGTHPEGERAEKWWLRSQFREIVAIDRTKAQFSDAVGNHWIDSLLVSAERRVSDNLFEITQFSHNRPASKEAYWYRILFRNYFPQPGAEQTVLYSGNSIACSTGDASLWNADFQEYMDPSGDAIHLMKQSLGFAK